MSLILSAPGRLADNFIGSLVQKQADFTVQFGVKDGLQDNLIKLKTSLLKIQSVTSKAENPWIKDETLKQYAKVLVIQLEEGACDAEDLLDEFHYRVLQKQQMEKLGDEASYQSPSSSNLPPKRKRRASSFGAVTISFFGREDNDDDVSKIREIRGRIDRYATVAEKVFGPSYEEDKSRSKQRKASVNRSTSSILAETQLFGRDREPEQVLPLLLKSPDGSRSSNDGIAMLTIVGIGICKG